MHIQELERRLSTLRKTASDLLRAADPNTAGYDRKITASTLPSELLQEIFFLCLPQFSYFISLRPTDSPVVLTHVCRHWRGAALGYARLWRSMNLKIRDQEDDIDTSKKQLEIWLPRTTSSRAGLHVISTASPSPSNSQLAFLNDGFSAIRRLTRLTLARLPWSFLTDIPPNSFPVLESLVLLLPQPDVSNDTLPPITAFEYCNRLERVAIGGFNASAGLPLVFPLARLTHLIIPCSMGADFWIDHLKASPRLRYVQIRLDDDDVIQDDDPIFLSTIPSSNETSIITLPFLRHITLWSWGYRLGDVRYPAIFNNVHFPQLRSLRFVAGSLRPDERPKETAALLDRIRSLDHLEILSLDLNRSTIGLQDLFRSTPHIRTLDIQMWDSCNALFRLLTLKPEPDADSENLLLNLRTLELDVGLDFTSVLKLAPSVLRDFVRSRMHSINGASRLDKVVFHGSAPYQLLRETPYIHCLRSFVKDGLKIDFRLHDEERSHKSTGNWTEKDEYLEGWREAGVVFRDTFY